jgi:hypothetical protein
MARLKGVYRTARLKLPVCHATTRRIDPDMKNCSIGSALVSVGAPSADPMAPATVRPVLFD